jgi:hypothetical protein
MSSVPHVHVAFEAQQCADRSRGDAVLAGAGLGDDAALSHALGQERLPERVVDLVRPGVGQVFALEKDARGWFRQRFAQPTGFVHRRGPAHVVRQKTIELRQERGGPAAPRDTRSAVLDGSNERFRTNLPP